MHNFSVLCVFALLWVLHVLFNVSDKKIGDTTEMMKNTDSFVVYY